METDRKGVLRRLIDAEQNMFRNDGRELATLRRHLREPIDEIGEPASQHAAADAPVLLAHAGRSWGP
jgi:hypothetical protein